MSIGTMQIVERGHDAREQNPEFAHMRRSDPVHRKYIFSCTWLFYIADDHFHFRVVLFLSPFAGSIREGINYAQYLLE